MWPTCNRRKKDQRVSSLIFVSREKSLEIHQIPICLSTRVRLQVDIDRSRTRPPCFALARAQGGHAERIHHPRRRDAATHKVSPLRTSRDTRRKFAARA
jgi:hypothetical protein